MCRVRSVCAIVTWRNKMARCGGTVRTRKARRPSKIGWPFKMRLVRYANRASYCHLPRSFFDSSVSLVMSVACLLQRRSRDAMVATQVTEESSPTSQNER